MSSELERRLKSVDLTHLNQLVRASQENRDLEISEWRYDPLNKGTAQNFGSVLGLYRLSGKAWDPVRSENISWSIILKLFGNLSGIGRNNSTASGYWKREVLAYQSGMLVDLPGALTAPRCFEITEYPNDEYWVWLEDLGNGFDVIWPLERYGLAARHLGQFNGAYLAGRSLPEASWLSRGRIQEYLDLLAPMMEELDALKTNPALRGWLNDEQIASIRRLWSKRELLLVALAKLPRCLCHHDAFRLNLMMRQREDGQEETVAIDWSYFGTGVIGEELGTFVAVSLNFIAVDATHARELDRLAFAGYISGLQDTGWRGETNLVRFGYTATVSLGHNLAHTLLLLKLLFVEIDKDDQRERIVQQAMGQSLAAWVTQWSALRNFYDDLENETVDLMKHLT